MVEVERYFGFGAPCCEEQGGLDDLIHRSDSLEDVIKSLKEHKNGRNYVDHYWINDMTTLEPVNVEI